MGAVGGTNSRELAKLDRWSGGRPRLMSPIGIGSDGIGPESTLPMK